MKRTSPHLWPIALAGALVLAIPLLTFAILGNDPKGILAASIQSLLLGGAILIVGWSWLGRIPGRGAEAEEGGHEAAPGTHSSLTLGDDILPASSFFEVSASRDPSVDGWIDTEIEVEEGSFIAFSVVGAASCHTGEETGPGGHPDLLAFNEAIGAEFPSGGLVAKIGDDPQVYLLDAAGTLAVDRPGHIFLAVNNPTGEYDKVQGAFSVTITFL